jgi:hypothetical protein
VGGGMGGRCVRYGWIGGRREKVRGLYGFSSLVKQNKKGKNCAVFCFAGKRNFFFYIYDVITWGEKKSSANHYYSCAMRYDEQASRTLRRNVVSHRGSSSSAIGVTSAGAHLSTNSEQGSRGVVCLVANLVWRYLGVRKPGFTVTWVFGTLVLLYSG